MISAIGAYCLLLEGRRGGVDVPFLPLRALIIRQQRSTGLCRQQIRHQLDRPGVPFPKRVDDQELPLDVAGGVAEAVILLEDLGRVLAEDSLLKQLHVPVEKVGCRPGTAGLLDPHAPPAARPLIKAVKDAGVDVAQQVARYGRIGAHLSKQVLVRLGKGLFLQDLQRL